jgi:hypothetical protein
MMMKMLEAGGIPAYTDSLREADIDNPGGYYELEDVKKVSEDSSWMSDAEGKAFKMVSMLLYDLPSDREYKIIFMERDLNEVIASQKKMLTRLGKETANQDDIDAKRLFTKHLREIKEWLPKQDNMDVMFVSFNEMHDDPTPIIERLNEFMGGELDEGVMGSVLDPGLYRNRADDPGLPHLDDVEDELDEEEEEAVKQRLTDLGYM